MTDNFLGFLEKNKKKKKNIIFKFIPNKRDASGKTLI